VKVRDLFVQITVGIRDAGAAKLKEALDGIVGAAGRAAPALDAAEKAAARQARAAEVAATKIERAEQKKAREAERSATKQAREAERAATKQTREAERTAKAVARAEAMKAREIEKGQRALAKATAATEREYAKQAAAAQRNVDKITRQIERLKASNERMTAHNNSLAERAGAAHAANRAGHREAAGDAAGALGEAGAGLGRGAAMFVGGLAAAGTMAATTAGEFETLRAQLKNVEGDQERANKAFAQMKALSVDTPFQLQELTKAYVDLRVRGVEPTDEKLTALGDLTSTFGYGMQEMTEAISAVTRGENDPIEKFGITARKVGDQVSLSFKGQTVMVNQTADAVTNALVEFGKMDGIAGAMNGQMATLKGAWSNFEDALSNSVDEAMQTSGAMDEIKLILGLLSGSADGAASALGTVLVDALRTVREWLAGLTKEDVEAFFKKVTDAGLSMVDMISGAVEFIGALAGKISELVEWLGLGEGAAGGFALALGALVLAGGGLPGLFAATAVAAAQMGAALAENTVEIEIAAAKLALLKEELATTDAKLDADLAEWNQTADLMQRGLTYAEARDPRNRGEVAKIDFRRARADQRFEVAAKAAREGFGEEFFATAAEQGRMLETQGRGGILTDEQKAIAATGGRNVGVNQSAARVNAALDEAAARAVSDVKDRAGRQGDAAAVQAAVAARQAGLEANKTKARKAYTEAMRKDLGEEAALAAAEAALLDTPKAKKGRGGKKAERQQDILEQLGLKGPGSILKDRPSPAALTISLVVTVKVAEQINVPITMPEGATFEGSAEAAGEAAGNIVQEAMIAAMMPKVEDALALRLTQFAAMKGGGRKPAQARRA
jgi:hypothetical protein